MNKVNFLVTAKFTQFSLEDQLKVKQLGRDLPDLDINKEQTNQKVRNRKFSRTLYTKNTWICGCPVVNRLFCFPCVLYGGDEQWALNGVDDLIHIWDKIRLHERSSRHMSNMFSLSMLGTVDVKIMCNEALKGELLRQNELVKKNRDGLDLIVNGIRDCIGTFDLVFASKQEQKLVDFSTQLKKRTQEKINKFPFLKDQDVNTELLQCIFQVAKEEIQKEIKSTKFLSVIVEEIRDFNCKIQLIVILRYLVHHKPVERFWNILYPESCDAQIIAQSILNEVDLLLSDDECQKLIAFSYDGAALVTGTLEMIIDRVKQVYPNVHYVHYYGHKTDLIFSSIASINIQAKIFYSCFKSLCNFISSSPQVAAVLNEAIQTQWTPNSLDLNIKFIYEHRKDLISVLNFLEKSSDDAIINQAGGFKFRLQDRHFIFWLAIFTQIIPQVVTIYNLVKNDAVPLSKRQEELNKFANFPLTMQKQMDVLLSEIENEINSSVDLDEDEFEEPAAKKPRLLNQDKCKDEAVAVINAVVLQVIARFKVNINATNLFRVSNFRAYRMAFPTKILDETLKQFALFHRLVLTSELQVVYERPELRIVTGLVPLLDIVANEELESTFEEVGKLLRILCTMPLDTAEKGRCFEVVEQVRTILKNTLHSNNISALILVSVEKEFISNDIENFNQKVINLFASKTKRLEFVFRRV